MWWGTRMGRTWGAGVASGSVPGLARLGQARPAPAPAMLGVVQPYTPSTQTCIRKTAAHRPARRETSSIRRCLCPPVSHRSCHRSAPAPASASIQQHGAALRASSATVAARIAGAERIFRPQREQVPRRPLNASRAVARSPWSFDAQRLQFTPASLDRSVLWVCGQPSGVRRGKRRERRQAQIIWCRLAC